MHKMLRRIRKCPVAPKPNRSFNSSNIKRLNFNKMSPLQRMSTGPFFTCRFHSSHIPISQKMATRTEFDTMGSIEVPADRLWGCQTQRSLHHFSIGGESERMPLEIIRAFGILKKACATVNVKFGLPKETAALIEEACDQIISGSLDSEFPLSIYQTGSGTQSNMNANEVISNYCIRKVGGVLGSKKPVHPNDHVNMSQSSNDTFPTAMHVAIAVLMNQAFLPSINKLRKAILEKSQKYHDHVKIGRTHLMDAVPMTLGQEFSAFAQQLDYGVKRVSSSLEGIYQLAIGGTAVGTGLNTKKGFGEGVAEEIGKITSLPFKSAPNKFEALAAHDAIAELSGSLACLASALHKMANDIRFLGSGPRCGLNELILPANEPGSSIMPGKVNPTQCEALTMICARVLGNHNTVLFSNANGHFQLNVYKPVIVASVLQSIRLLSDGMSNFEKFCVEGMVPNHDQLQRYVSNSLMLVTALNPHIGYEKGASIAKKAHTEGTTLKQAALQLGYLTEAQFDEWVDPLKMFLHAIPLVTFAPGINMEKVFEKLLKEGLAADLVIKSHHESVNAHRCIVACRCPAILPVPDAKHIHSIKPRQEIRINLPFHKKRDLDQVLLYNAQSRDCKQILNQSCLGKFCLGDRSLYILF